MRYHSKEAIVRAFDVFSKDFKTKGLKEARYIIPKNNHFKTGNIIYEKIPGCDEFRKIFVKHNGDRIMGAFNRDGVSMGTYMQNSKGTLRYIPKVECITAIKDSEAAGHLGNGYFQYSFGGDVFPCVQGRGYVEAFKRIYEEIGMKWSIFEKFIKNYI